MAKRRKSAEPRPTPEPIESDIEPIDVAAMPSDLDEDHLTPAEAFANSPEPAAETEQPEVDPLAKLSVLPAERGGGFDHAAAKVRDFPQTPGVYLMKDRAGRVIYVGKARICVPARAATFSRPRPWTCGRATWCRKSGTSTFCRWRARSMRFLPNRAWSRISSRNTTAISKTARAFRTCKSRRTRTFPASKSRANRAPAVSNFTAPLPVPQPPRGGRGIAKDLSIPHLRPRHRRG